MSEREERREREREGRGCMRPIAISLDTRYTMSGTDIAYRAPVLNRRTRRGVCSAALSHFRRGRNGHLFLLGGVKEGGGGNEPGAGTWTGEEGRNDAVSFSL
eukprot:3742423-Rhodomonas_salina.1